MLKEPMPTPRCFFGITVYQGKIFCIGGRTTNGAITGANEVYDPSTDTWENKTPMPTVREMLQANVVNGKIYLIGGYPGTDRNQTYSPTTENLNEVYDPATDSWASRTPMPTGADGYASAVVGNKIFIISGMSNQIYNTENDEWSLGTSPAFSVYGAVEGTTMGTLAPVRFYVFGVNGSLVMQPQPSRLIQIYNPENDNWSFDANSLTNRVNFGVAVLNDKLYVVGGSSYYYPYPFDDNNYVITQSAANEQYTPFGYGTINSPSPSPTFISPSPSPTATPTPSPSPTPAPTPTPSLNPSPSIPEFPSFMVISFLMVAIALTAVFYRGKNGRLKQGQENSNKLRI